MIENNYIVNYKNNCPKVTAQLSSICELNSLIERFPTMISLKIIDNNACVLALYDNLIQLKRLEHLKKLCIKPTTFFGNDHCKVLVESCPNLKSLKIAKSSITSASFSHLVELKNLEKLNLEKTLELNEFEILHEKGLAFPKIKELNLFGIGGSSVDPNILNGESLIRGLNSFPNLEKLVVGLPKWRDNDCVLESENTNWVSQDFSKSALDIIPFLPNLSTLEILNHYFLDLRSVVRVENLRNLTSLSIPSTILQHEDLNYLADIEDIRKSFADLNKFVKLENLVLNFASDRFELSTPSCECLEELENHPSLKTFTAYFGSFNFKEMERVFHIAKGVNKIIFEASEFIYDEYEPEMNPNITSLEIRNNQLDEIQDDYFADKIYDDFLCEKKLNKSFDPLKEMNMAEEILIRKSIDELKLSPPQETYGQKRLYDTFQEYLEVDPKNEQPVYPTNVFVGDPKNNIKIFQFRRIATTINYFPFSKFVSRLSELILSCPEEFLKEEAFQEIGKLPNLERLVLGAGTDLEEIYEGIEAISNLILAKCSRGIFDSGSRVKKVSKISEDKNKENENLEILPSIGLKRICEIVREPTPKKPRQ